MFTPPLKPILVISSIIGIIFLTEYSRFLIRKNQIISVTKLQNYEALTSYLLMKTLCGLILPTKFIVFQIIYGDYLERLSCRAFRTVLLRRWESTAQQSAIRRPDRPSHAFPNSTDNGIFQSYMHRGVLGMTKLIESFVLYLPARVMSYCFLAKAAGETLSRTAFWSLLVMVLALLGLNAAIVLAMIRFRKRYNVLRAHMNSHMSECLNNHLLVTYCQTEPFEFQRFRRRFKRYRTALVVLHVLEHALALGFGLATNITTFFVFYNIKRNNPIYKSALIIFMTQQIRTVEQNTLFFGKFYKKVRKALVDAEFVYDFVCRPENIKALSNSKNRKCAFSRQGPRVRDAGPHVREIDDFIRQEPRVREIDDFIRQESRVREIDDFIRQESDLENAGIPNRQESHVREIDDFIRQEPRVGDAAALDSQEYYFETWDESNAAVKAESAEELSAEEERLRTREVRNYDTAKENWTNESPSNASCASKQKDPVVLQFRDYAIFLNQRLLFTPLSISLRQNEKILIKGANGIGKSSILKSFFNMADFMGDVYFHGKALHDIKAPALCAMLSICPQESLIFKNTVRFNLQYGNYSTDEEMRSICRRLRIYDLIEELEDGFDSVALDAGENFSGGEQRKLCVARTVLKKAEIYWLDEPTAGLDEISARAVIDLLMEMKKTVVVVMHGDCFDACFDRIIELKRM